MLIVTSGFSEAALEVTAMVQGVSESDGTCTLEILDSEASTSVPGTAGNGVTYCGLMSVVVPNEVAETGSYRVTYVSSTTQAESAPATLESSR